MNNEQRMLMSQLIPKLVIKGNIYSSSLIQTVPLDNQRSKEKSSLQRSILASK